MQVPSTLNRDQWPPDYVAVYQWRQSQVLKLRANPALIAGAKAYYAKQPVEFINHWGVTYDPRNASKGLPTKLPFILFTRQAEFVDFIVACASGEAGALVEKSRDMGATWLCSWVSIWMWLFWKGSAIGWGSRKEGLVDRLGDADSIFEKLRMSLRSLPAELMPVGFSFTEHANYMKIVNPENGSSITGEAGDNIGRGGRKSIFFKDEAAYYERPESIEAALSENTRVQVDISSVHGLGNVFHRRREGGLDWLVGAKVLKERTNVFVFDWRDHPAKTQEWYDAKKRKAAEDGLLHVFAQEVDRNYAAALEGAIIQDEWIKSAIDAHIKLGFDDSGGWIGALDVADGGADTNALALRKGSILKFTETWGERDTGMTARRAVTKCGELGVLELQYDSIGVGAGVKSETNRLRDENLLPNGMALIPWNAGAEVLNPERNLEDGDTNSPRNIDFYGNLKAQAWWQLRRRFERTHRALTEGIKYLPEEMISLPSDLPQLRQIEKELSQPIAVKNSRMKLIVDKSPEGMRSPNIADAIVMAFWPIPSLDAPIVSPFVYKTERSYFG